MAGIFVSAAMFAAIVMFAFRILPFYPDLLKEANRRSFGFLQGLTGLLVRPDPYIPFITTAVLVIYALITQILIYYFFEKTQSPEILFFALFACSCAAEGARISLPLRMAYGLPGIYAAMASRALFFARYFGICSLFAGSLYAAGLEMQKQGRVVLITMAAALVLALGVPIDGLSWDSSLSMIYGYMEMFVLVEWGLILITAAGFLVSAYSRSSREYFSIAGGTLLVCAGKDMLLRADTWITPLPAFALLVLGTWLICTRIRRIYLWL
jgi:hypothetical protein